MTLQRRATLNRNKPMNRQRSVKTRAPKAVTESVKIFPDGREVCLPNAAGNAEYKQRTEQMSVRQAYLCALCGLPMREPTFDHERSRGHGGAFRDDRIEVRGAWQNAAVHWLCNGNKGSKRRAWRDGKYMEVTR